MALTVSGYDVDTLTMDATAGEATKVTFSNGTKRVRLEGDGCDVYWSTGGTDGGAFPDSGSDKCTVPAGSAEWVPIDRGAGEDAVLYIGASINSGEVIVKPSRV